MIDFHIYFILLNRYKVCSNYVCLYIFVINLRWRLVLYLWTTIYISNKEVPSQNYYGWSLIIIF